MGKGGRMNTRSGRSSSLPSKEKMEDPWSLDARGEDCDHQNTEEGRPWRGDWIRIQKMN